jgi:hypothetical protein
VPSTIAVGQGYWVAYTSAKTDTVLGTPATTYTRTIPIGWNMIGSVTTAVPQANIVTNPTGRYISGTLQRWDGTGYVLSTSIAPTGGYWAAFSSACDVTITGTKEVISPSPIRFGATDETPELLWSLDLKVESQGTERTLRFGTAPNATVEFDKSLDKIVPPPPPTGVSDIYFDHEGSSLRRYETDIRESNTKEWTLTLTSNATISWDPSAIPEDRIFTISGTDMSSQGSLTVNGPSTIKILAGDKVPTPKVFAFSGIVPNPFAKETGIKFQLPVRVYTTVTIYSLAGQAVRTLANGNMEPGYYKLSWDGKDNYGTEVGTGVYFCKLEAGEFSAIRKLTLLK